jgi:CRISPR-associated endonuclease Csn1
VIGVGFVAVPVIGIDVGANSVGCASIILDENDSPIAIHRAVVYLHDGGKDGMASGQSATVSRKASGGAARRVRRLYRNRRKRRILLEQKLAELGYPVIRPAAPKQPEELNTYDEWVARANLLQRYIADDADRLLQLSIAIRHMSNHRGWANAWVPLDVYLDKEAHTVEFDEAVKQAVAKGYVAEFEVPAIEFQSQLAALGLSSDAPIRPRTHTRNGRKSVALECEFSLLGKQRREDVVREWKRICEVQKVPRAEFEALARIAFAQEKPYVPIENVGNDWLPGYSSKNRASIASLEHQEFLVRQTVANLGIKTSGKRQPEPLSVAQQELVVDTLMGIIKKDGAPSWGDVAESALGIPANRLVSIGGFAPILRSVAAIHGLGKSHPVFAWWVENSQPGLAYSPKQADFVRWFADPTKAKKQSKLDQEFGPLFDSLNEKQTDAIVALKFPAGRSAHCVEALQLLNREMAVTGDTYVEVRNRLFGGGKHIEPKLATFDIVADHPTLQRVLPPVRRFIGGVEREVGKPERVVVEHVRNAFLGFAAKSEEAKRQGKNRKDRENAANHIRTAFGIENPTDDQIRRVQAYERQNCQCLYCGASPGISGIELDHIVPRASGGNSTKANLVAVCRDCNAAKGREPFAVFVKSGKRPSVTMEGGLDRVNALLRGNLDLRTFGKLKAEMKRRLKQTDLDEPIDERALASTAYAAVDMRDRIRGSLDLGIGQVPVYPGRITQAARKASGIDKKLSLRGLEVKSRFDRRHHGVDALVTAMLNPSVAKTLAEREDLRMAAKDTGNTDFDWKQYEGASEGYEKTFRKWKSDMNVLAELVKAAIEGDEIAVISPVRFSANHAKLHEDGRIPHATKRLGDEWTAAERALIVDDRVYESLSLGITPADALPADDDRTLVLPSGKRLDADGLIYVFPDSAARLPLPHHSSAKLGSTIHHARIYRWLDRKGRRKAGVVRMWASDLYDLQGGINGDILSAPLAANSRAVRRSSIDLREAFYSGTAELVGSVLPGDEVWIDPAEWAPVDKIGRFLQVFPEQHWRITGVPMDRQIALNPIFISQEGIRLPNTVPDDRKREVDEEQYKIIADRAIITAAKLWETPATRIIRRTASGRIREGVSSGLPTSWSPYELVNRE